MSDVVDLGERRERAILRRVEALGERVGACRRDGEEDEAYELRVLATVAALFRGQAAECAEARRLEVTARMHLTPEYRWMPRSRPLPTIDFETIPVLSDVEAMPWLTGFSGAPSFLRRLQWRPRRLMSVRGHRYLALEPRDGWNGVSWEDLARAYDAYEAHARDME